jgi:hypothetical protein
MPFNTELAAGAALHLVLDRPEAGQDQDRRETVLTETAKLDIRIPRERAS